MDEEFLESGGTRMNLPGKWLNRDPYRYVMRVFMTKWKPMILTAISFDHGTTRYTQFKKGLPISEKVLTENLRELEADGLINRTVYAEIPSRVEYTLTESGESVVQLLFQIYDWGYAEMERRGLPIDRRGAMFHGHIEPDPAIMQITMREYLELMDEERNAED